MVRAGRAEGPLEDVAFNDNGPGDLATLGSLCLRPGIDEQAAGRPELGRFVRAGTAVILPRRLEHFVHSAPPNEQARKPGRGGAMPGRGRAQTPGPNAGAGAGRGLPLFVVLSSLEEGIRSASDDRLRKLCERPKLAGRPLTKARSPSGDNRPPPIGLRENGDRATAP